MGVIMKRCLALFMGLIVIQLNVGALNGQEEIKDANIVVEEVSLHEEPEYVGVAEFDDDDDDEGDDDDDENEKEHAYDVDDEDEEHDADEDDDDDENQEDFDDDNDDDEYKQEEF